MQLKVNMTKILIIRQSSIGDIVLTTPVLRTLKNQLSGEIEIHYLVKKNYRGIIDSNPNVDQTWAVDNNLNGVIDELATVSFDYVIDLHNNIRSSKIKSRLSAKSSTVNKLNVKKWLWVNLGLNLMPDKHIVDRYMEVVKPLGVKNDNKGLDYFIPKEDEISPSRISQNIQSDNYIAWPIGATYKGKKFSIEKSIEILKHVEHPVILLGGEVDVLDAEKILRQTGSNIYSAVGQLSLNQSASIVKQSKMVVTPDTGLMHIASAFKKNIISIWGCTSPGLGMSPYLSGPNSVIIEPEKLNKRPCSKLGNRCKYKGGCINRISLGKLVDSINQMFVE